MPAMSQRVHAVLAALALSACQDPHAPPADDARRGAVALRAYGCGACHRIPGIAGAHGTVGPPLERMASRAYVAGRLPNTPGNLARWIAAPQHIVPGSAMPQMGVTQGDARDIAAWLWRAS